MVTEDRLKTGMKVSVGKHGDLQDGLESDVALLLHL